MTIFQAVQNDIAHRGDLVRESQLCARSEKQISVGVNSTAEVEVRTGEVVAVAVAKDYRTQRPEAEQLPPCA